MRIALDVMGGDKSPKAAIEGAVEALADSSIDFEKLFLVGDETTVQAELDRVSFTHKKIEVVHAPESVEMHESAVKSVRQKKKSSIAVSLDLIKKGECEAFVSAGNTGAVVAASTIKLRTIPGIERAGIASPLPNEHGPCNMIDAGANVEAKPSHLLGYGIMGAVYANHVQGKENPRVGLMSVGEEDSKGTDFTREVFQMLKDSHLNFVGNIEGHDLFESHLDVVVCDGFVGNVLLKTCEATAKAVSKWLRQEMMASPIRQLGGLIAKGAFKAAKERGNYETYGGSPLLGVNGIVIIGHGSSSPRAIKNAIRVGAEAVKHHVNPHIEEEMAQVASLLVE
ncbi:MAG: phosphate acyltransferase [Verrucomicrobiales bacterium]|nr:phosphate acyltransferase [Verrucomicrobiales bacterium]|tara:strand:- start:11153 stop:12169 length:1017 start_codon:yes stop_codon:yes gene_type:complete